MWFNKLCQSARIPVRTGKKYVKQITERTAISPQQIQYSEYYRCIYFSLRAPYGDIALCKRLFRYCLKVKGHLSNNCWPKILLFFQTTHTPISWCKYSLYQSQYSCVASIIWMAVLDLWSVRSCCGSPMFYSIQDRTNFPICTQNIALHTVEKYFWLYTIVCTQYIKGVVKWLYKSIELFSKKYIQPNQTDELIALHASGWSPGIKKRGNLVLSVKPNHIHRWL